MLVVCVPGPGRHGAEDYHGYGCSDVKMYLSSKIPSLLCFFLHRLYVDCTDLADYTAGWDHLYDSLVRSRLIT